MARKNQRVRANVHIDPAFWGKGQRAKVRRELGDDIWVLIGDYAPPRDDSDTKKDEYLEIAIAVLEEIICTLDTDQDVNLDIARGWTLRRDREVSR